MKKALLVVSTFLSLYLISCKEATPNGDMHCKDYSGMERKNMLDARLALQISNAYLADSTKAKIGGTGQADATSVWYSLEELKKYIWQLEDTMMKQGCDPAKLNLGFHVYFAKYPDSSKIKDYDVDPSYAGHQTVFFVPTYTNDKAKIDFNPWNVGNDKNAPTPLSKLLGDNRTGDVLNFKRAAAGAGGYGNGGDGGAGGVFNHGDLAPPPSGTGIFPSDN